METVTERVRRRVRAAVEPHGVRAALARALHVKPSNVGNFLLGRQSLRLDQLDAVADFLDVSIESLVSREDVVTSPDHARQETRPPEGGEELAEGFLEQALMSLAPEVRGQARLAAMAAAIEAVASFLPGAAVTRESGAK